MNSRLDALRLLHGGLEAFGEHCLKVMPKTGGSPVPFIFNRAQQYVHDRIEDQREKTGGIVRAVILKGRQQGISTYTAARFYHRASMNRGVKAFIVAHEAAASSNLFDLVKRYHENNPLAPSTGATNAKELVFDKLDGGYKVATAGTKDVGRSATVQLMHACLAGDTLVLMADGSVREIATLQPGDLVRTKSGEAAPVFGISWKPGKTLSVSVGRTNIPIRATAEHKFWTKRGMVELKDLSVGDLVGFPVREITGEITHLPFASEVAVRAQGGGRSEFRGPETVELTFELGRIMGLYLAEGYVALQSKAPHEPSNVVFACHERELDRNTAWIKALDLYSSVNVRENKGSKTRMTVAYGRQFAKFIHEHCGRKEQKHLPDQWWRMPREFVRGLMVGYLAGDGHCRSTVGDRSINAPSVVAAIAFGMRDVVASLGYGWAGIRHRNAGVRNERKERAQYTLTITGIGVDSIAAMIGWEHPPRRRVYAQTEISDGFAWLPIKAISDGAEETVFDIEVDHPDHDYCLIQCATSNSEFAFWDNAALHIAGIGQTIADAPGTEIILESTANGQGNTFHEYWQLAEAGLNGFIAIFVPWFWQEEYCDPVPEDFAPTPEEVKLAETYGLTPGQLVWRRRKIAGFGKGREWLFQQEYPCCPAEAFVTATDNPFINPTDVMAAVNSDYFDKVGPLVIGVDPAESATGDKAVIAFRRGRVASRFEAYQGKNPMELAGIVAKLIHDKDPDAVFIDIGGLGSGVYARLKELGFDRVFAVNFGSKASDSTLYSNKKAEIWDRMRQWFADAPVRMVNEPEAISDICSPSNQPPDSSGRLVIEKKEKMKARGQRSPDYAEALALTFSEFIQGRDQDLYGVPRSRYKGPASSAGY